MANIPKIIYCLCGNKIKFKKTYGIEYVGLDIYMRVFCEVCGRLYQKKIIIVNVDDVMQQKIYERQSTRRTY